MIQLKEITIILTNEKLVIFLNYYLKNGNVLNNLFIRKNKIINRVFGCTMKFINIDHVKKLDYGFSLYYYGILSHIFHM